MTAGGNGVLSIGALSAATGIPVETIRSWERRYGFPVAGRKPSGHRVYPVATVPRLRLINEALARGHRAAEVVPASEAMLEALLDAVPRAPVASAGRKAIAADDPTTLFEAVRLFDAESLKRTFQAEWARRGPLEFVEQIAAPFLTAVGDAWQQGLLDVRHEHFASAMLGDFLRTVRMPLDERASGPLVALATLPGERHGLGLQLSALVFALAGWRVLMLGVETPPDQIVALTKEAPVAAIALSFVLPDGDVAPLRLLRRRIARTVPLLIGGAGVRAEWGGRGIYVLPDLPTLDEWVRSQQMRR
jgi:MerR family transcriptional regulator, light-induced transcriptional regulator